MKKLLLINFLMSWLFISSTFAGPKRIQSVIFDKGQPHKLFLHPGLGAVISFPCFVSESFIGDESQAEIKPSPSTRKNLLLSLKSSASKATNLIVRCEGQTTHFVLDIIPSNSTHQDILEIRAAFGHPEMAENNSAPSSIVINQAKILPPTAKLLNPITGENAPKRLVLSPPVLIDSSKLESK